MRAVTCGTSGLEAWVERLITRGRVVGPRARGDRFVFAPLERAADLRLDHDVTLLPPKKYLQPPRERLLRFDAQARYTSCLEGDTQVLFGLHPYDQVAINQMDKVFLDEHCDVHYRARRRQTALVVCDVQTPSPHHFAGYMNAATVESGHDVHLTRLGERYCVEARTARGETLLADLPEARPAEAADLSARDEVWAECRRALRRYALKAPLWDLPGLMDRSFDHPVWAERAERCFACGACTQVCPTCYCFDVRDDVAWNLQDGARARVWDSCQLKDFATVAGAHNFRKHRTDRYRHRYYRKARYVPEKVGAVACVGCGRCVAACVSKIAHPVEVFNRLWEGA